ncbi:MAG: DUF420 domain-containing protein, partial [Gemmatimonadota bacterium]|nr:DUF420 domain-containing protein [Gemmatimonadota bacterium]
AHRSAMLTAFSLSVLFLALYVARKASAGFESLHFHAGGAARIAYLALLGAHLILAPVVPVMAILLIVWAVRGRLDLHRRLARIAWPIWMFVSVSGIVIYLLVYPLNPVPGPPPIPE